MDFFEVTKYIIAGGFVTTLVTEIAKSPYLAWIHAEKYPRFTAAAVSLGATIWAYINQGLTWTVFWSNWVTSVEIFAGVLLVATLTYTQVLKGSGVQTRLKTLDPKA